MRDEAVNAEWALRTVSESLHALFSQFSDAYLRERSTDLDDVIGRIQLNLRGSPDAPSLSRLPGPGRPRGRGPHALRGGRARLGPGAGDRDRRRLLHLPHRDHRALAGHPRGGRAQGGHAADPARQPGGGGRDAGRGGRGALRGRRSRPSRAAQEVYRREEERLRGTRGLAARTLDGVEVRLEANVEFPEEAATAQLYGAEGIGLFRSEYLLGRGPALPDRGAAARRLPPARRADAPAPGDRAHLGRGARGARPLGAVEPEPGARGEGAAPAAPVAGALPGAAAGAAAGRAPRARSGSCSRS